MHVQLTYQQPICRTLVLTFCPTKGWKICIVMTHKVIFVIQKTESSVYHSAWLRVHATFDISSTLVDQ